MHSALQNLISLVARLPGLGQRSARRIALHLAQDLELIEKLANTLRLTASEIKICELCSNIDSISPCAICIAPNREKNLLCVVEGVGDLWALERSKLYNGLYQVLGGALSAIEGKTPETLNTEQLKKRLNQNPNINEVIIATNATLEGESTGHYIASIVEKIGIKTTRLAHGIPMGAELDHMDDGTLGIALRLRQLF